MITAIVCIAGIGLVASFVLAVADKYLSVQEDPRIGLVLSEPTPAHLSRGLLPMARVLRVAKRLPQKSQAYSALKPPPLKSALRSLNAAAREARRFA